MSTSGNATSYGAKLAYRTATNNRGSLIPTTHNDFRTPRWVRISRFGNIFTAEASEDGAAWVVLGSALEPAVDRALLAPSAGDAPPMLWIETARYVRERGEFFWTGFTLGIEEETLSMIAAVGPFRTGAQVVASRTATAGDQVNVCTDIARAVPTFDASDGSVQLITEVESVSEPAYNLELVWSNEVNRLQAVTLTPGDPPTTEQSCELQ